MPDQPSKESLKLATAFFIGYFGNDAEKYHPSGIKTLALEFDAIVANYQTYGELKRKWMAALAAHAPAEAEAKEKRSDG